MFAFKYLLLNCVTLTLFQGGWVRGATIRRPDREMVVDYVYDIRDEPAAEAVAATGDDDPRAYQHQELIFAPGSEDELRIQPDGSATFTAGEAKRFPRTMTAAGDQRVTENQAPNAAQVQVDTLSMASANQATLESSSTTPEPPPTTGGLARKKRATTYEPLTMSQDATPIPTQETAAAAKQVEETFTDPADGAKLAVIVQSDKHVGGNDKNCVECMECIECRVAASGSSSADPDSSTSAPPLAATLETAEGEIAPAQSTLEVRKLVVPVNPAAGHRNSVEEELGEQRDVEKKAEGKSGNTVQVIDPMEQVDFADAGGSRVAKESANVEVDGNVDKMAPVVASMQLAVSTSGAPNKEAVAPAMVGMNAEGKQSESSTKPPTAGLETTIAPGKVPSVIIVDKSENDFGRSEVEAASKKVIRVTKSDDNNNQAAGNSVGIETSRLGELDSPAAQLAEEIAAGQNENEGVEASVISDAVAGKNGLTAPAPATELKKVDLEEEEEEEAVPITGVDKSSQSKLVKKQTASEAKHLQVKEEEKEEENMAPGSRDGANPQETDNNGKSNNKAPGSSLRSEEEEVASVNVESEDNGSDEETKAVKRDQLATENSEKSNEGVIKDGSLNQQNPPAAKKVDEQSGGGGGGGRRRVEEVEEEEGGGGEKRESRVAVRPAPAAPLLSKVVVQDVSPAKKSGGKEEEEEEQDTTTEDEDEEEEGSEEKDDEEDEDDEDENKSDSPGENAFTHHGKHLGRRKRRESPSDTGNVERSEGRIQILGTGMEKEARVFVREKRSAQVGGSMRETYVDGQKVYVDVPLEMGVGGGSTDGVVRQTRQTAGPRKVPMGIGNMREMYVDGQKVYVDVPLEMGVGGGSADGVVRRSRQTINEYIGSTQGSGTGKFPVAFCELERDTGIICPGVKRGVFLEQFYYDSESNRCSHFVYNGCGGNANRFSTLWECNQFCGKRRVKQSNT